MDPAHTAFLHTSISGTQFTDAFGETGEMDFMETPVGMVYVQTRRIGENLWVRMNDYILPNIRQVAPTWETGEQETYSRPWITNWAVPVDDTHSRVTGFRRVREAEELYLQPRGAAQRLERSYEDRQRTPGDYEAQVGQRPIAVHALEHLADTDRGVIMLRRMLLREIRAVGECQQPRGLLRSPGEVICTYANDTIMRIPAAGTPEEGKAFRRKTGWEVAEGYLDGSLR